MPTKVTRVSGSRRPGHWHFGFPLAAGGDLGLPYMGQGGEADVEEHQDS